MNKWTIPVLSTLVALIISALTYADLPQQLAVHFGTSGDADSWMTKPYGAFVLPLLIPVLCGALILSRKFEKDENKRRRAEASLGSVMAIISALLLAVHSLLIVHNLGYEMNVATTAPLLVGGIFIVIGNMAPRLPQKTFTWPRLTDGQFRRASRFQGRVMVVAGLLFLLTPLLPNGWVVPAIFLILSMFVVLTVGSLFYFRRLEV